MKAPKAKKRAKRSILIPRKYIEAVENGVKWLDLTFGRKEWLKRMNMSNFDIQDPTTCVAGNVFRTALGDDGYDHFEDAIKMLGLDGTEVGNRLGFFSGLSFDENNKGWQHLQDLWVMKIKKLKRRRTK